MTISPSPHRRHRWRLAASLVVLAWLGLELAAGALLSLTDHRLAWPSRLAAERRAVEAELAAGGEREAPEIDPAQQAKLPRHRQNTVLHPFLGFVESPQVPRELPVNAEGFSVVAGEPPRGERFTVAVFGGSMAQQLCLAGGAVLRRRLASLPQAAGRDVWLDCYALGGYKQPQQLNALSYALARGVPIDLVINLDGFNDVVLAVAENLPNRVNPFYPRGWQVTAGGVADRALLRRAGEVAFREARRASWAATFDSPPLAWSWVAHIVWRAADRREARRITELQAAVSQAGRRRPFQQFGPPYPRRPRGEVVADLVGLWARSSRLMGGLCRARGIPYFHFLQPNQYVEGSKPMGLEERRVAVVPDHLYAGPARDGYPALIAAGRELAAAGEAFFDLTQVFVHEPEPLYVDACCHVSREGSRRLAREIAARVQAASQGGGRSGPGVAR